MGGVSRGGRSINILVIVPETDPIQGHLACDTTRGGAKWPHGIRHTRAIKMPTLYSLGVGRCSLASWHTLASLRGETKGEGWPKWATEDGGKWRTLRMKLWRAVKCWPPSLVKLGEAPRWQTKVCAMTGLGRLPSHPFVINHWWLPKLPVWATCYSRKDSEPLRHDLIN